MHKPLQGVIFLSVFLTSVLTSDDNIFCSGAPDNTLVRDPSACYRFFRCSAGVAHLKYCPEGQYFDFYRQLCDNQDVVLCLDEGGGTVYPTPIAETTVSATSNVEYLCVGVPNNNYVKSYEACNQYYQCLNGIAFPLLCPQGQYFDLARQTCDTAESVACDLTPPVPPTPSPTLPPPPAGICDGIPNFQYVIVPGSCYLHVQCVNAIAYPFACDAGEWFDEERQECDNMNNVNCDLPTPPTPEPTPSTYPPPTDGVCNDVPDGKFVLSSFACYRYYQCENGEVEEIFSCPIGEWFDEERQVCDVIANVDCVIITTPPTPEICDGVPDGQYVSSPNACYLFYVCLGGVGDIRSCPIGEWFDEARQTCDDMANVECDLDTTTTTPYPTPPSTELICVGREDFTYVPSPTSCSLFYMCLNELPYAISCPPNQWFDFERQQCDYEENVECNISTQPTPTTTAQPSPCNGIPDGTYVPLQNSCTGYYLCINDNAYPQECPGGLYFDEGRQLCDLAENVVCDIITPPTTTYPPPPREYCSGIPDGAFVLSTYNCYMYYLCEDNEVADTLFCPIGEWFDEDRQVCDLIANVECGLETTTSMTTTSMPTTSMPTTSAPEGDPCASISDGQFVRSQFACYVYYECFNGVGERQTCPIGEWFDEGRQVCDVISNVDCDIITTSTPPTTPEICDGVPDGQYVRSPNACYLFYVCLGGVGDIRSCPIGEWFDEGRQVCDVISNVDCDIITTSTPPTTPEICDGVPDGQYVRSPNACYLFYVCFGGVGDIRSCPIGEWFDESRQVCDVISNVDCDINTTTIPPTTPEICDGVPDGQYVRSPNACYLFYVCFGGVGDIRSCPIGEWFDEGRQVCDVISNVDCDITTTTVPPTTPEICDGVPDGQYVRSPNACYLFYVCLGGVGDIRSCPIGEWFDENRQVCDVISNVDCDIITTTIPPTTPEICDGVPDGQYVRSPNACYLFYVCFGGVGDIRSCPIGEWFDEGRQVCDVISNVDCDITTTTVPPTTPEVCDGVPDGQYVRSPNACYLFYVCLGGVGDIRSCPIGEWFDEGRQTCDEIANVDCDITTVPPTTTALPSLCYGQPDNTYVASPSSCSSYYLCLNNMAYPQLCFPGQYFDAERQMCDIAANVDCDITTVPPITTALPSLCYGQPDNTYVASPSSCSSYYLCLNNMAYPQLCFPGQYFDAERQMCDIAANVDCDIITVPSTTTALPSLCYSQPDNTYVASPNSCSSYYSCVNNMAYPQQCLPGKYFDIEQQMCDDSANVVCNINTAVQITTAQLLRKFFKKYFKLF